MKMTELKAWQYLEERFDAARYDPMKHAYIINTTCWGLCGAISRLYSENCISEKISTAMMHKIDRYRKLHHVGSAYLWSEGSPKRVEFCRKNAKNIRDYKRRQKSA